MLYIPDIVSEPDPVDGLISRACMAKYLLGLIAEDFSQTYHFVSWTEELPEHLWAAAHDEEVDASLGKVTLPAAEQKLIRELAVVANGWWIAYPNFAEPGDSFMPLDQWRERFAARNQA